MANNTMYFICPVCKGHILLGKNMADGWYRAPTKKALEKFYDDHSICGILEKAFIFVDELETNGIKWRWTKSEIDGKTKIKIIKHKLK